MTMNNFCVFIISHGRPRNIITLKTLEKINYTGPLYIVCDNEDKTLAEYQAIHTSKVLVFDKKKYASLVDNADNFQNRRTTTHARNACFDLAESMGYEYFIVFDDDYTSIHYVIAEKDILRRYYIKNAKMVFNAIFSFLESDKRIKTVCFLQGGDLMGGAKNSALQAGMYPFKRRKAMNSFFCKTSRRFWFFSRLNEDVNTYTTLGSRGNLFGTIPMINLVQTATQSNKSGITDMYLDFGTYVKSMYTIMYMPSCVKLSMMGNIHKRIHHKIKWDSCVPKIISVDYKKQ